MNQDKGEFLPFVLFFFFYCLLYIEPNYTVQLSASLGANALIWTCKPPIAPKVKTCSGVAEGGSLLALVLKL